jgi:hypothetical protein
MADVIEIFADGTRVERDFTEAEIAQRELDAVNYAKRIADDKAKIKAKAELLEKLGITAEEAQLLIG